MPPPNGGCGLWLMCDVPLPIEATEAGPMEAVSTVIDKHALQARSQNAVRQHGAKKRPRDAAYFAAANRAARARKKARAAALEEQLGRTKGHHRICSALSNKTFNQQGHTVASTQSITYKSWCVLEKTSAPS